jgi:hypothetical protein
MATFPLTATLILLIFLSLSLSLSLPDLQLTLFQDRQGEFRRVNLQQHGGFALGGPLVDYEGGQDRSGSLQDPRPALGATVQTNKKYEIRMK